MYHVDRAAAMTAYFLEQAGGELNDIILAKLQYIAERRSLVESMVPITDDSGVSLNHGPCLSITLNLTNNQAADPLWDSFIGFKPFDGKSDNSVVLINRMPWAEYLSEADIEILNGVWKQFGHMKKWDIKNWCHRNYKEYKEVGQGGFASISLESIFIAEGDDPEVAAAKAQEIRYQEQFEAQYGFTGEGAGAL